MKQSLLILFMILTFNICESYAQKYQEEIWTYFPKEPRFLFQSPEMVDDIVQNFKESIKNEGIPIITLYKTMNRERILVFWVYIGEFKLSNYYDLDFDNPFPELFPIPANFKVKHQWYKNSTKFINHIGINYSYRDSTNVQTSIDSLIIKIDTVLLKKAINPYGKLRNLNKIY